MVNGWPGLLSLTAFVRVDVLVFGGEDPGTL